MFTKNTVPTLISMMVFGLSYTVPETWQLVLRNVGLFAFSGAITNWLAVHMLFEKVPGLYGSGVIPARFEELKAGLLVLVKEKLFKKENVQRAFDKDQSSSGLSLDFEPLVDSFDLDNAYEQLKEAIMQSSFGSALNMFGGEAVLEPLRDKFKEKIRNLVIETSHSEKFQRALSGSLSSVAGSDVFLQKIEEIVQDRLDELTPSMVKDIMQSMIRQHLGWLVVWGAVFGGVMGLVFTFVPTSL
ncbi:MAG: DUF445 domain-containing protein [Arenicella sp.]